MKKLSYFFVFVAILATMEFGYSLLKYAQLDWLSLFVMICLVTSAFSLRKRGPQH